MAGEISFKTLEELEEAVRANGDVATVMMWNVRDAYGQERLGVHVRAGIEEALEGLGLGHSPDPIPAYQDEMVRIYKKGTAAAALIAAVQTVETDSDDLIREAAGGEDAAIVKKVRELVCS